MTPIHEKALACTHHTSGNPEPGNLGFTVSPIHLCSHEDESPRNEKWNPYRSIALSRNVCPISPPWTVLDLQFYYRTFLFGEEGRGRGGVEVAPLTLTSSERVRGHRESINTALPQYTPDVKVSRIESELPHSIECLLPPNQLSQSDSLCNSGPSAVQRRTSDTPEYKKFKLPQVA